MVPARSHFAPAEDSGFLALYFGSWVMLAKNFLALWGIAVIFVVPLGFMHQLIYREYVKPYFAPLARYYIAEELPGRDSIVSDQAKQEILTEFKKNLADLPQKKNQVVLMFVVDYLLQIVGWYFLAVTLFLAVSALTKGKDVTLASALRMLQDRFSMAIDLGWRLFFYVAVLLIVGKILFHSALIWQLANINLESLTGFDLGREPALKFWAQLIAAIGAIVLLVRLHVLTMILPFFAQMKSYSKDIIAKTYALVSGHWLRIFGNIFFAGFFNLIIVAVITVIVVKIATFQYGSFSWTDIDAITNLQKITFMESIYPVLTASIMFPVSVIFLDRLYRVIIKK